MSTKARVLGKSIEKAKISKKKAVFIILILSGIIVTAISVISAFSGNTVFEPVDTTIKVVDTKALPDSGNPLDYKAQENFAIAAGVLNDASYFEAVTDGVVIANVMGGYKQTISSRRYKKGNTLFHEAISDSTFKTVAEQKFFTGKNLGDTILFSKGNYKKGTWADITALSNEDYSAKYGIFPAEICKYFVNSKTVTDSGYIGEENGIYEYYLVLDPTPAAERYKHEMKTMGGAEEYPTFESIKLTYKITENWVPVSLTVEEKYNISIPVLGQMSCNGTLTETFSEFNNSDKQFPPESARFFEYAKNHNSGEVGEIVDEKEPVDYLSEAFAKYINGAPINIEAKTDIMGYPLDFGLNINIEPFSLKLKVSDDIFIAADDKKISFKLGETKGSISMSALNKTLESLNISLDALTGNLSMDDLLAKLFVNMEMVTSENEVHILMPFSMFDIDFNIDIGMVKVGETYAPSIIVASIDLTKLISQTSLKIENPIVKVNLTFNDDLVMPEVDSSYKNLDAILDFVPCILNTVEGKGFDLSATLAINSELFTGDVKLNAKIALETDGAVTADLSISAMGIDILASIRGSKIYVTIQNIEIVCDINEIDSLIEQITPLLGDIELPSADIIESALAYLLPSEINIDSIFKILSTLEIKDNTLSLSITPSSGNPYKISISHNDKFLESVSVDGLKFGEVGVALNANLDKVYTEVPAVKTIDEEEFVNIQDLVPYIEPIMSLINSQSLKISLNGNISISALDGILESTNIKGEIGLSYGGSFGLYADFSKDESELFGHDIFASYINNKLYLELNDMLKLSFDTNNIGNIISIINSALTEDMSPIEIPSIELPSDLDINSILNYINEISFKDDALRITLTIGDLTLSLNLPKNLVSENTLGASLSINMSNEDGEIVNANFSNILIHSISSSPLEIPLPSDAEEYVTIESLADFIQPIIGTLTEDYFDIAFSGSVEDEGSENAESGKLNGLYVKGQIQIVPTTEITSASFPEMYLQLFLGTNSDMMKDITKADHKIYVLIKQNANDGDYYASLNYNDLKVSLSFNTALKIIGAVAGILDLKIPPLDALLEGIYDEPLDMSIFEGMDITGLNEIRDMINSLFKTLEGDGVSSAIEDMLKDFMNNTLNSALRSISLDNKNGLLNLNIYNSLFNKDNEGTATISLKHTAEENHLDSRLSALYVNNLIIGGKIINLKADLTNDYPDGVTLPKDIIPEPSELTQFEGIMDLNSVYDFLDSVISTAAVEQFEISGSAGVEVIGINAITIDFDVKVKIMNAGTKDQKVYAAVRLSSGAFVGVLDRFTSYIYFDGTDIFLERNTWKLKFFDYDYETHRIKLSPTDFLDDIIEYVLFVIPFSNTFGIADKIRGAGSASGESAPLDISKILKGYNYSNNTYSLKIGLGELVGDTAMLSDLDIGLSTKPIANKKGVVKEHLYRFDLKLKLFNILNLSCSADLANLKNNDVNQPLNYVFFGYNGEDTHYESRSIETMPEQLNKLNWGTRYDDVRTLIY